ncbi:MAG: cell division protein FtsZ, partial [Clostridia bacterium]|nr:cell division protein FtsZ [Clostridia bacterium]
TIIAAGFGEATEEPVPAIGLNFDAPVAAPVKPAAPVEDDTDVIVKKATEDYDDDFDVPSFLKGSKR